MTDKACFKCGEVLPLSEFYAHPRMRDGTLNKCRRCARRDVQENRAARAAQYRAYERERNRQPERIAAIQASARRDATKRRARVAVSNAVARGKLTRGACEVCGGVPADGHHEDYNKPLEVRWLCRTHHMHAHRMDEDRRRAA